jgi:electron transfer flavoprotein alpha subunit
MSQQDVFVLTETAGDALAEITLELLGAARAMADATGGEVIALALGPAAAAQSDAMKGADRVIAVNDPALDQYAPAESLAVLESLIKENTPRAVLIGSTSSGIDLAPALASRLGSPIVSGCVKVNVVDGALTATTSFCAGKMLADVEIPGSPAVLVMLPGACAAAERDGAPQVEMRDNPAPVAEKRVVFEQMIYPEAGDVDITKEEVLIGIGRGIEQEDNMEVVEELARSLGGQLCASRPIVDQGWLPTTRQVGKSGMTVKPKCYFALGMSGAPEHVEGMKDSHVIIAVNTDASAPIFEIAHYGVVADLLDLVPAITEAIREKTAC